MQRPSAARINSISRRIIRSSGGQFRRSCDVFINHRGVDTKRNVAGLLYHHLRGLRLRPFLDSKSMKPGDRLFDRIEVAIRECKVGVAVFSPMYCDSYFCLHELKLMMEARKKVVPIFCDVKPSELRVKDDDDGSRPVADIEKFRWALEEAKNTVGITFDTLRGDWPEFLASATDAVIKNLIEVDEGGLTRKQKYAHASFSSRQRFS
ncbi:TIR-only protein [Sesamum alatum]|uniref:TIR-only protein n=1 Tax=Sesamum alatum TaxID=300844 RepID=A0AAE1Y010_9LAMI|nr:TIR-only protein [Sesamum alatum]